MRRRKLPQTFSITIDQLERLTNVADRLRTTRSALMEEAIEIVLQRHESGEDDSGRGGNPKAGAASRT